MSHNASSLVTMRGCAVRACCEEMVLMNGRPLPTAAITCRTFKRREHGPAGRA